MKAKILHLETSTKTCSVAISDGDKLLSLQETMEENYSHAEKLNVFVEKALNDAGLSMKDLSAISVSKGPGSFTGLRIGVSSAKGFAYALDIPLISCNTLECLALGFIEREDLNEMDIIVPMIDARREEVYRMKIDEKGSVLSDVEAEIIDLDSFNKELNSGKKLHFIGDGAAKFSTLFKGLENVIIHPEFYPSAKFMLSQSTKAFEKNQFEDLAYFEPFYLKEFIAIKPRRIF
jgi:tRNA threonylcarbamoyladenosine biosynthesis protein TsaB